MSTKKNSKRAAKTLTERREETYASWKRNLAEGNTLAAAGDYDALKRLGAC